MLLILTSDLTAGPQCLMCFYGSCTAMRCCCLVGEACSTGCQITQLSLFMFQPVGNKERKHAVLMSGWSTNCLFAQTRSTNCLFAQTSSIGSQSVLALGDPRQVHGISGLLCNHNTVLALSIHAGCARAVAITSSSDAHEPHGMTAQSAAAGYQYQVRSGACCL